MPAPTSTQLAAAAYEALNQHDTDRLARFFSDDIQLESTAFGVELAGAAAAQQYIGGFITAFPDFALKVLREHVSEDGVVAEVAWSGTHDGPLASPAGVIPPTGRRVEGVRMVEIFTIRGGKIARLANYHDAGTWMRQLGLG